VRPAKRPLHLLFLDKPSAHYLVDGRFHERGADRFPLPVPLPEVRYGFPVVANVGLEFCHPSRQFLCRRRALSLEVQVDEEVAQTFQRLVDIAVPQQVLDTLHLLRYLRAAGFLFLQRLGLLLENR